MADLVIVLGAGSSCEAGAPLMNDFLDRARDLRDAGRADAWRDDFDLVFRAIGLLGSVHSKSQLDLVNLEAVFNSFEMARQLRKFPGLAADEIERLVPALTTVIVRTLEECMMFPTQGGAPTAPSGYRQLSEFISWARRERKPPLSVAVLTFNYDVGIDVGLASCKLGFAYHLTDESGTSAVPLLKLHGSLNWIRKEDRICELPVAKRLAIRYAFMGDAPQTITLPISRDHPDLTPGESALPIIVPPTMSKGEHHREILPVWRRAAIELGEARHVVICGYSMPNTDEFFKVLYALGSHGKEALRSFTVVDTNGAVHDRIRGILGPGAEQRFRAIKAPFSQLGQSLRETFKGL